jgi:hypothetical protein
MAAPKADALPLGYTPICCGAWQKNSQLPVEELGLKDIKNSQRSQSIIIEIELKARYS